MSSIQIEPLTEMTSTVGLIAGWGRLGWKRGARGRLGEGRLGWREGEAKQGREVLTEAGRKGKVAGRRG